MQDVSKIVVKRLQEMALANPHPEPELLAAFAEQALDQSERSLVLDHLARCAECRQIVELALPEAEPERVSGSGFIWPRLSLPVLRWGLGTAAVLALISVAVLRYEQRHGTQTELALTSPRPTTTVGQANVSSAPSASTLQQGKPQALGSPSLNPGTLARSQSPAAQHSLRSAAKTGISSSDTEQFEGQATKMAGNRAPDQLIEKQAQPAPPYQPYATSDVVKAKAAVSPQTAESSAPVFALPNIPLQTSPSLMQRTSPRWDVTASGGLQRSFDAGKTWQDVSVNVASGQVQDRIIFRAVAAIGPQVWAGGSGAILYHSSDSGTSWQTVLPSVAGAQLTGDVTQIEFPTPQEGKITTSTGEQWITSDNGQTWTRRR